MLKPVFPITESDLVSFWNQGYLYSAHLEVRRSIVVVTIYNGFSVMFCSFRLRKSDILADEYYKGCVSELRMFGFDDPALLVQPLSRVICNMAYFRLSPRSQRILLDSYICASEIRARLQKKSSR